MADRVKIFATTPVGFPDRRVECEAVSMAELMIETTPVEFTNRKPNMGVPEPANNFPYTFPIIL